MRSLKVLALSMCAVFTVSLAHAAGFAIKEQSVSKLGNAFAGAGSEANDPSIMFYNPAGMTQLKGNKGLLGVNIIAPSIQFTDNGSTASGGAAVNKPNDGKEAGSIAAVPNAYLFWDYSPDLKFGFSVNSPFGLKTEYSDSFIGRYQALKSEIKTISAGPNAAYRVNDYLSIGGGVNIQYVDADLTNMVQFSALGPFGDEQGRATGDDIGYGYILGIMVEPDKKTRLGLSYRSKVHHTLRGDGLFDLPNGTTPATFGGTFAATSTKARLVTPDSLLFSAYHEINDRWAVMSDIQWTGWSTINELRIRFDNPAQPDSVTTMLWNDAMFYSAGTNYKWNENLTLRFGAAYDESPVDGRLRGPRVPDADRYWLATGASYRVNDGVSVDVGYTHIWLDDAKINKNNESATFSDTVIGEVATSIDILSVQAVVKF